MFYNYYYVFNTGEFEAQDLTSKTYNIDIVGIGTKSFLVTKGVAIGVTYEGIFLEINFLDKNPFQFENNAIYIDENNNVSWGIAIES